MITEKGRNGGGGWGSGSVALFGLQPPAAAGIEEIEQIGASGTNAFNDVCKDVQQQRGSARP